MKCKPLSKILAKVDTNFKLQWYISQSIRFIFCSTYRVQSTNELLHPIYLGTSWQQNAKGLSHSNVIEQRAWKAEIKVCWNQLSFTFFFISISLFSFSHSLKNGVSKITLGLAINAKKIVNPIFCLWFTNQC